MSHKGSQETFEFIGDWIDPKFFFSKNDVWHRMGMLGVFGDYVLSCMQGDIAEIGCGESSIYLSHLARKYGRKIYHCDIAPDKILNPLTVNGYMTENAHLEVPVNFNPEARFDYKNSVFFCGPSDDLFQKVEDMSLCLSFVDGDHNYAQAKKDFENLLQRTVDHGFVFLHDTYPPSEEYVHEARCGDVYKLRHDLERGVYPVDVITLTRGTAMSVGLTIVRKRPAFGDSPWMRRHE